MTIYIDMLGRPEPRATISHLGGSYGRGGYLSLHTTSDSPDDGARWDNVPDTIATIAAWAYAHGYDITEGRDGYGAYKANLIHRETARALAAIKADEDAIYANAERGYVRMGDIPMDGKSRNRASGQFEAGVSVFAAEIAQDGRWRPILDTPQLLGSYLCLS